MQDWLWAYRALYIPQSCLCHDCSVPLVNNISAWEPGSFAQWHWASAIDGRMCSEKRWNQRLLEGGEENQACQRLEPLQLLPSSRNGASPKNASGLHVPFQAPHHWSRRRGDGRKEGTEEKGCEGPAAHRDTVRLAGTWPQTCPVGQHGCQAGPQVLKLMAEAQVGWQCPGNRKLRQSGSLVEWGEAALETITLSPLYMTSLRRLLTRLLQSRPYH